MSENKLDVEKFKKLMKDPSAVMKLGFILVVAGFVLGYCASFVAETSESAGVAIMQAGQVLLLFGVLFFVYYFLMFFEVKKGSELLCPHCDKPTKAENQFCPHCGQDTKNGAEIEDSKKDSEKEDEKKD